MLSVSLFPPNIVLFKMERSLASQTLQVQLSILIDLLILLKTLFTPRVRGLIERKEILKKMSNASLLARKIGYFVSPAEKQNL